VIQCMVENITFLGSIVRVQLHLGESMLYMDTFNNPFLELPKLGDKAEITFSAEAVLVLSPSSAAV
jgi:putative spermidine/putrescine transport system ATP-binding protein